jgi:hypothetical protein
LRISLKFLHNLGMGFEETLQGTWSILLYELSARRRNSCATK